ncbi:hypothetical protein, partial [Xanthomonas citri]|uniref:hypothetical protein n=1 Tax=Xanthomonas citri TaxID=346 RepID=UPI001A8C9E3D
ATGDGADALYALPRERFAHGKQLSWLRDRANQDAIYHAMKKRCLQMPKIASECQTKSKKGPHLRGLSCIPVLLDASRCQMSNHSHSIVAGGLPEMS